MKLEKIKNIVNGINDLQLKEKLNEFVILQSNHSKATIKLENVKNEKGYEIKISLMRKECIGKGDADSSVAEFIQKEVLFFIPIDLKKLQEAYDSLPAAEKAPADYDISVDDETCMTALFFELDMVMLNLKHFNGKDDNYEEIARVFSRIRAKIASIRNDC